MALDTKLNIDFLLAVLYARNWEGLFVRGRGNCNMSIRSFQAEIMWFSLALSRIVVKTAY